MVALEQVPNSSPSPTNQQKWPKGNKNRAKPITNPKFCDILTNQEILGRKPLIPSSLKEQGLEVRVGSEKNWDKNLS